MVEPSVVAENVIGLIGTIFWSIQLVPQAIKNYRSKSTQGLSPIMMFLWAFGTIFFCVYAILLQLAIPLIIQPILFGLLALFCYCQCIYYGNDGKLLKPQDRHTTKATLVFVGMAVLMTGCVVGSIFLIQNFALAAGIQWPLALYGYLSIAFILMGFIPQFIEIYRLKQVIGISLIFMAVDMAGGFFSVLSLLFRHPPFDFVAAGTFIAVIACDLVIVILFFILRKKDQEEE